MSGFISCPYILPAAVTIPGGGALTDGETDALGIDFTYHTDRSKQMSVLDTGTPANAGDFDPYSKLTYTSPSVKLCRQSDGVYRYGNHNYIVRSQELDSGGGAPWNYNAATISANATTAPDGTLTADKLQEDNTNNQHYAAQTVTHPAGVHKLSVYAKAADRTWILINLFDGSSHGKWFDIGTGALGSDLGTIISSSITSVGSGWYKCTVIADIGADVGPTLFSTTGDSTSIFTGTTGFGVYYWGIELKRYPVSETGPAGTSPTGYIATTSAAKFDLPYEWDAAGVSQGLLIEEQRTNLLTGSQTAGSGWSTTGATVTSDTTTAPDGTTTADTLVGSAGSGVHQINRGSLTVAAAPHTFSIFVKPFGYSWVELILSSDGSFTKYYTTSFNVTTGAVGTVRSSTYTGSNAIVSAGNGWYRCSITVNATDANSTALVVVNTANTDAFSAVWTTNGTDGHYVWGSQLEQGSFPTSPIHTISATVTRAADAITLANSAFPIYSTAGTVIVKYDTADTQYSLLFLGTGTNGTAHMARDIGTAGGTGQYGAVYGDSGSITVNNTGPIGSTQGKAGYAFTSGDSAFCINGTNVTNSDAFSPALANNTTTYFGSDNGAAFGPLNGHMAQMTFIKRRITDTELQTRTT